MVLFTTAVEMATPNTSGTDTYIHVGPDGEMSDVELVDIGIPTPISMLVSEGEENETETEEDFHSQYFPSTPSEIGPEDVEEYNLRSGTRTCRNLLNEFLAVQQEEEDSE